MLPTALLNVADLSADKLQVTDFSTKLVTSATPEATFASLMVPLPEPDVALVPPVIGQDLPVEGETLPAATEFLPVPENHTGPLPPVTTAEADVDLDLGATTLIPEAADSIPLPVSAFAEADRRALANEQSGHTGRLAVDAAPEPVKSTAGNERPPVDRSVISAERGRLIVGTGTIESESTPLAVLPRDKDQLLPIADAPATNRRLEAETMAPRVGQERVPNDVTREAVLMPEAPAGRDPADATGKPAVASASNAVVGAAEALLQRHAVVAPKGTHTVVTTIDRPVLDEGWGDSLQERVLWMTSRKIQSAEIRLNPAELGPVRVQVSVQDDAAVLNFTAQHSVTREAIEQAMPRLREMLNESGLTLAGTTVSDSREERAREDQHAATGAESSEPGMQGADDADVELTEVRRSDVSGLVDTFV